MFAPPETRDAKNGDVHIACQVAGDRPLNLVWFGAFVVAGIVTLGLGCGRWCAGEILTRPYGNSLSQCWERVRIARYFRTFLWWWASGRGEGNYPCANRRSTVCRMPPLR